MYDSIYNFYGGVKPQTIKNTTFTTFYQMYDSIYIFYSGAKPQTINNTTITSVHQMYNSTYNFYSGAKPQTIKMPLLNHWCNSGVFIVWGLAPL
jgi:hypothetical protein